MSFVISIYGVNLYQYMAIHGFPRYEQSDRAEHNRATIPYQQGQLFPRNYKYCFITVLITIVFDVANHEKVDVLIWYILYKYETVAIYLFVPTFSICSDDIIQ